MILEKSSSTPIYIQLKNILKQSIMAGEIKDGEAISSETQLAKKYNITRTTVRMAISELVNENLLRKEHGKGTFVRLKPVRHSMLNFSSFTEYFQKKDKIPVSKILKAEKISIADKDYFKLERARGIKEDRKPLFLTVDTSLLPVDLFPAIINYDFEEKSLYNVMREEFGIAPDRVELSIKPHMASARICNIFDISKDEPLLLAKGLVYSEDNRLIEELQVIYSPSIDFKLITKIDSFPM